MSNSGATPGQFNTEHLLKILASLKDNSEPSAILNNITTIQAFSLSAWIGAELISSQKIDKGTLEILFKGLMDNNCELSPEINRYIYDLYAKNFFKNDDKITPQNAATYFLMHVEDIPSNNPLSFFGEKKRRSRLKTKNNKYTVTNKDFDLFTNKIGRMILIESAKESASVTENTSENTKVIYNNDGYNITRPGSSSLHDYREGEPLTLDLSKEIPIGYNIHYPPNGIPVDHVIVEIYGGGSPSFSPKEYLGDVMQYLNNRGAAVIQLNLPDLLKLTKHQNRMPESLHQEIHACINKFYQTLSTSPEQLHPDLIDLKDKRISLYGASFGGLMAIRHAELYPKTFDGYISHDGILDAKIYHKADLQERKKTNPWLNPGKPAEIAKIEDPILLMHNMDDNNVNAKSTLHFYKKLSSNQKTTLARIYTTDTGNPIPDKADITNKGHFAPTRKTDFIRYADTVDYFLQNGPSSLSAVSMWRGYRKNIMANRFYRASPIYKQFVTEARDIYKKENHNLTDIDSRWESQYKPLFYALWQAHELCSTDEVEEEIQRLIDSELLTDEVLMRVLNSQAKIFKQFIEEFHQKDLPSEKEVAKALGSKQIITKLKKYYHDNPSEYFLVALYKANPSLLKDLYPQFEENEELEEELKKAKSKFHKTQKTEKKLLTRVWRSVAEAALTDDRQKKSITHPTSEKNPKIFKK